jgi:Protein of unknown function (DUF2905)
VSIERGRAARDAARANRAVLAPDESRRYSSAMEPRSLGLLLVGAGAVLALVGLVTYYGGLSWFGRLPGDIRYESESAKVFVPVTSMIVISLVLTLVLNLVRRLF